MKLYFIIILFISPLYSAYTQQITIKNKATGEPLESVAIFNQGKNSSCLSDENGVASLSNFKAQGKY